MPHNVTAKLRARCVSILHALLRKPPDISRQLQPLVRKNLLNSFPTFFFIKM